MTLPYKIFCLSFARTGTTYLHKLARINNYSSIHGGPYMKNWKQRKNFTKQVTIFCQSEILHLETILNLFENEKFIVLSRSFYSWIKSFCIWDRIKRNNYVGLIVYFLIERNRVYDYIQKNKPKNFCFIDIEKQDIYYELNKFTNNSFTKKIPSNKINTRQNIYVNEMKLENLIKNIFNILNINHTYLYSNHIIYNKNNELPVLTDEINKKLKKLNFDISK